MCSSRILIFALFCIISVLCEKKIRVCDLNDSKCLTASASRMFKQFIAGVPGVEPSDPLHVDLVDVNLPCLKYKIINGSLSGMKNCHVELVQISQTDKNYHYHIGCPHLVLESGYEIKGKVGPEFIEGKGICRILLFDYNFLFNGDLEIKDCNDTKTYIHLKNSKLELEAKGRVHYDFDNLFNGNTAKSEAVYKFVNENWQYVDKLVRQPAMEAFMKKYIEHVNALLRKINVQHLFFEES